MNRIDHTYWSYDEVVAAFGPHNSLGDVDKTTAQWDLETPYGWAEIYDYKHWPATHGDPRKVLEWHVQAATDAAFVWVYEQIESARRAAKTEGRSAS